MFFFLIILVTVSCSDSALLNVTCPNVNPLKVDLKELDGKWYFSAASWDLRLQGNCAMVRFKHTTNITTDLSVSWVTNRTANYYNGSAVVTPDLAPNSTGDVLVATYSDKKVDRYYFLDVNYEHYAVLVACKNNTDGASSTLEIWQLSRRPHLKDEDAVKINEAMKKYQLETTQLQNQRLRWFGCRVHYYDVGSRSSIV